MSTSQNSLIYKSLPLFDGLVQRPLPEQRDFEIEYFELLKKLPRIIDEAFDLTNEAKKKKRPLSMNRNWFANEISGNVLDLVAQNFPSLVKYTGRGSYCLMLNYKYECYIKKLTSKKLTPIYNHTKTSKRLRDQVATTVEEPIPVIYLGWTINNTNDMITGYYAVCRKGSERIWCTDLTAIQLPEIKEVETQETSTLTPSVIVKVKEKRKAK